MFSHFAKCHLPSVRVPLMMIVISVSGCGSGASCNSESSPGVDKVDSYCSLLVGIDADRYYDNDIAMPTFGGEAGGSVVLYINDSPVMRHTEGAHLFPIYPFLHSGKNQIRAEGKHTEKMFMKVVTANPARLKESRIDKVLAKTLLEPGSESVSLEFDAITTRPPDYEVLPSDPESRTKQERELRKLVDYWIACCAKHDGEAIVSSLIPELKSPPPYMKSRTERVRQAKQVIDVVNALQNRLVTKKEDVRMVFGKRSVLVFAGTFNGSPYLFHFESNDPNVTQSIRDITMVRLEGKWTIP
jgi:hypothetical protein